MSFELAKNTPRITLKNEPKLSEHEANKSLNEKRVRLVPFVESFISTHEQFKNQEVAVTFSEEGVSSLVSVIESPDKKFVLKIPLIPDREGESRFLKVWENQGVSVPHVVEEGVLGGHPYMLMDHVNAITLEKTGSYKEMVEKETFVDMGRTLRSMHEPKTQGYGRIVGNKPEFGEFKDWLENSFLSERIAYCQENMILGDEHGSVSVAFEALLEHVANNNESSYCHNDFAVYNVFDTEPITVFDPSPSLNNGYVDLGKSIVISVAHGKLPEASAQLVRGYFNEEAFDEKALQASILLNSYAKASYWHKRDGMKKIETIQKYLIQNRHFLES